MSTVKVNTIQDSSGSVDLLNYANGSATGIAVNSGRKNLIINGAMQVAQRGTSGFTTHNTYTLDRWKVYENTVSGSFTVSQDTDAPANFKNSLKFLVGTAGTPSASSVSHIRYLIEGNDFARLGFGTSDAQTYTVSFWVKSSIAGTYCLGTLNNAENRSIAKEYTINSANTWEYKTITIAGDTSGTYLTDNGKGIQLIWDLGSDSAFNQTVDTYSSTLDFKTSNQTTLISNAGATFYLTGVQLEVGSVATPFEHRSYGEELALCQRYYQRLTNEDGIATRFGIGNANSSSAVDFRIPLTTEMRTTPAFTSSSGNIQISSGYLGYSYTSLALHGVVSTGRNVGIQATGVSGVTQGNTYYIEGKIDRNAWLGFDAEL